MTERVCTDETDYHFFRPLQLRLQHRSGRSFKDSTVVPNFALLPVTHPGQPPNLEPTRGLRLKRLDLL
jgi:hypothetical protein